MTAAELAGSSSGFARAPTSSYDLRFGGSL
jgi:hypothetical protein